MSNTSTVDYTELLKRGGEWLGVARDWMQRNCRNGSRVTWGSTDVQLEYRFTPADVEEIAARAVAAYINSLPHPSRQPGPLRGPFLYCRIWILV